MQFSTLMTLGLAAISAVAAAPANAFNVEITFIGGPASYTLNIPADGNNHTTSSSLPFLPHFPHLIAPTNNS